MKRLAWILVLGVCCAAAALFYVRSTGGFTARRTASSLEVWVARALRGIATPSEAKQRRNPVALSNEAIAAGLAHWADHCAGCHANNGSGQISMGQGMFPPASDMRLPATQRLTDGELFFIIENGIPWTGMPAWGHPGKDGTDTWNLVHFIRHLPSLTFEERREMERLNPKGPDQLEEERQQQQFLEGESK
jgi:mono/diheme cytochrome c family protein